MRFRSFKASLFVLALCIVPAVAAAHNFSSLPLSKDPYSRVLKRQTPTFRKCYEQGLRQTPELQGKVVVQFIILPSGRVTEAVIPESSLNSRSVEACMLRAVRKLVFPKPMYGGSMKISYRILFYPVTKE